MTYSVRVSNKFERGLRKLSRIDCERIWKLLEGIEADPNLYKPLSGQLSGMRSARTRVTFACSISSKRMKNESYYFTSATGKEFTKATGNSLLCQ